MEITNLFLSDKDDEVHIDYLDSEPCFYTGIKSEYNQLPTSWFEFTNAKTAWEWSSQQRASKLSGCPPPDNLRNHSRKWSPRG